MLPLSGAFHTPLLTTLRKDWFPSEGTFEHFQQQVNNVVQHLVEHTTPDLQTLHDHLMRFSGQVFNTAKTAATYRQAQGPFRRFQEHTRQLRQVTGTGLSDLFMHGVLYNREVRQEETCHTRHELHASKS